MNRTVRIATDHLYEIIVIQGFYYVDNEERLHTTHVFLVVLGFER